MGHFYPVVHIMKLSPVESLFIFSLKNIFSVNKNASNFSHCTLKNKNV